MKSKLAVLVITICFIGSCVSQITPVIPYMPTRAILKDTIARSNLNLLTGLSSNACTNQITKCTSHNGSSTCYSYILPNLLNCQEFSYCDDTFLYLYTCPENQIYDAATSLCIFKRYRNCVIYSDEPGEGLCANKLLSFVPFVGDDTKFVYCGGNNKPKLLQCGPNQKFVKDKQSCRFWCPSEGRFADSTDPRYFYECIRWSTTFVIKRTICRQGTFDILSKICKQLFNITTNTTSNMTTGVTTLGTTTLTPVTVSAGLSTISFSESSTSTSVLSTSSIVTNAQSTAVASTDSSTNAPSSNPSASTLSELSSTDTLSTASSSMASVTPSTGTPFSATLPPATDSGITTTQSTTHTDASITPAQSTNVVASQSTTSTVTDISVSTAPTIETTASTTVSTTSSTGSTSESFSDTNTTPAHSTNGLVSSESTTSTVTLISEVSSTEVSASTIVTTASTDSITASTSSNMNAISTQSTNVIESSPSTSSDVTLTSTVSTIEMSASTTVSTASTADSSSSSESTLSTDMNTTPTSSTDDMVSSQSTTTTGDLTGSTTEPSTATASSTTDSSMLRFEYNEKPKDANVGMDIFSSKIKVGHSSNSSTVVDVGKESISMKTSSTEPNVNVSMDIITVAQAVNPAHNIFEADVDISAVTLNPEDISSTNINATVDLDIVQDAISTLIADAINSILQTNIEENESEYGTTNSANETIINPDKIGEAIVTSSIELIINTTSIAGVPSNVDIEISLDLANESLSSMSNFEYVSLIASTANKNITGKDEQNITSIETSTGKVDEIPSIGSSTNKSEIFSDLASELTSDLNTLIISDITEFLDDFIKNINVVSSEINKTLVDSMIVPNLGSLNITLIGTISGPVTGTSTSDKIADISVAQTPSSVD